MNKTTKKTSQRKKDAYECEACEMSSMKQENRCGEIKRHKNNK